MLGGRLKVEGGRKQKKSFLPFLLPSTFYLLPLSLVFMLTGCASSSGISSYSYAPQSSFSLPVTEPVLPQGIYHAVQKGETVWRIARAYQVPIEEIVRINRMPDATRVKLGQRLFIPGGRKVLETSDAVSASAGIPENFIWPAKGKIAAYFNSAKGKGTNKGIDIGLKPGSPVLASLGGKISFAHEKLKGLGKTIIIDHGEGYQTVYGHLSEILVQPGDEIEQGRIIAKSGNTGRSVGDSLHFEVRRNHSPKNPLHYLP